MTWDSDAPDGVRRLLRGTELRYAVIRLLQLLGPSTIHEILDALDKWGFAVEGRPSKTVSDALRRERRRDRVRRIGWGVYRAGAMPRSTEHRIITRVTELREEVASMSLGGGHMYLWSETPESFKGRRLCPAHAVPH